MNSFFKAPISSGTKVSLVFFTLISVINLMEFIFDVHEPRKMVSAIGFALMGYGTYKNGLTKEALDLGSRYASIVGFILVFVGIGMRYLP